MKKVLIIYNSVFGNTKKVVDAISSVLQKSFMVKAATINTVKLDDIRKADVVGFASGIYYTRHHKSLLEFVDGLPPSRGKKAFVVSTSGAGGTRQHKALISKLLHKGFFMVAEFACKGHDKWGPLRLVGGINRGRPNEEDLKRAEEFAKEFCRLYKKIKE